MKNQKKSEFFSDFFFFDVKNSKFANRLKRALLKFRGDRSEVRGVNGRSKFVAASVGRVEREEFHLPFGALYHCLSRNLFCEYFKTAPLLL